MKTTQKIKITAQLDFADVTVNGKINSRFQYTTYKGQENAVKEAKVACFNLLWELTESGNKAEIIPYIN